MNKFILNLAVAGILISTPLYPNWIKTPSDLSTWLVNNFTYQAEEEGEDYWKKPQETVRDKSGDCEDLSFLVDKILTDLNYKTQVIAVFWETEGHAICIIEENNKYSFFSNQYYFSTKYNSIKELVEKNYPTYKYYKRIYLK